MEASIVTLSARCGRLLNVIDRACKPRKLSFPCTKRSSGEQALEIEAWSAYTINRSRCSRS